MKKHHGCILKERRTLLKTPSGIMGKSTISITLDGFEILFFRALKSMMESSTNNITKYMLF